VFGRVSEAQLVELYQRAWVFCLPSTYEGFGVPYIEAMAAGCPVVATPNSGAREVLDEGAYGRVVADAKLGSTLVDLLEDPTARAELARRGRRRVSHYDWSVVVDEYERVYAALLC
jgi:glycosyltransferase involved in cell wall biosynthesis